MTLNILFSDRDEAWTKWEGPLRAELHAAGITANVHRSYDTPQSVDFVIYSPASPLQDFSPYTNLKAVLSMWAGVESIQDNRTLTVPLTRMVDPGLTEGMVEYVTGHMLRHHLGLDRHIKSSGTWMPKNAPPLARNRTVGFLGLGALGAACAQAAARLNFDVHGWSRTPKSVAGLTCHDGEEGLGKILSLSEILVLLLPLTDQTRDLMNAHRLSLLPKGACLINPGRGHLIVDDDLIAALDTGQIAHATLDVFRQEPLPSSHVFWSHPGITVTPHIAAETRAETAAKVIVENIIRAQKGQPLLHQVDRTSGY